MPILCELLHERDIYYIYLIFKALPLWHIHIEPHAFRNKVLTYLQQFLKICPEILKRLTRCYWRNPLLWRHNGHDGISNHRPHYCLLNCLFRHRSKKASKLRVPGLCEGNSPVTGEFPAQRASNAEEVSIWWRHHAWQVWIIWNRQKICYNQI